MYRQLDFINKICSNFEYWSNADVIAVAVERYQKFIKMMAAAYGRGFNFVPTLDIDLAWHAHQSDHEIYKQYCSDLFRKVGVDTFDTLIDHDDSIGASDLEKGYATTYVRWSRLYKEPYSPYKPSYEAWMRGRKVQSASYLLTTSSLLTHY